MKIIIYGSNYGTTKTYATELSRLTGIPSVNFKEFEYSENYDTIIYLGALYAGGVLGMKKAFSKIPPNKIREYIIATVGLSDPMDPENVKKIKDSIESQVSKEVFEKSHIICLRGGMDYSKLRLKHKFMMSLVYNKARKIPEEDRTEETRAMIETYNKKVDFVDFENLKAVIGLVHRDQH